MARGFSAYRRKKGVCSQARAPLRIFGGQWSDRFFWLLWFRVWSTGFFAGGSCRSLLTPVFGWGGFKGLMFINTPWRVVAPTSSLLRMPDFRLTPQNRPRSVETQSGFPKKGDPAFAVCQKPLLRVGKIWGGGLKAPGGPGGGCSATVKDPSTPVLLLCSLGGRQTIFFSHSQTVLKKGAFSSFLVERGFLPRRGSRAKRAAVELFSVGPHGLKPGGVGGGKRILFVRCQSGSEVTWLPLALKSLSNSDSNPSLSTMRKNSARLHPRVQNSAVH
ncbi:MAG: hypothetical protein CM15mP120_03580 [Pseudomonadota bacterium]|nr:MAG: hypothetical protein CM15mP120_03580 [Pseudomonadota bacterium]